MFYIKRCYNCDLAEKVIHHILDKHREENNKEWFNISNELAIYVIDIVCNFLDSFINASENLPLSNLREWINLASQNANTSITSTSARGAGRTEGTVVSSEPEVKIPSMLNKVVKIECNEDKYKRFIEEFCELGDEYSVLSYELFGAYRIWAKGATNTDRSQFAKFIKKHYTSKRKYYKEHDSSLLTYFGIKPRDLVLKGDQDTDNLPKYEEFILTECKYNYNYRMGYTTFMDSYKEWCYKKYGDFTWSKKDRYIY